VVNNGEIGTSLLSDFFGSYPQIMSVVWDYNFYKYGSFPPLSPYYGRTVLGNPSLPGTNILTNPSACDNSGKDDATANWTAEVVGVTVVVIILIFVIVCVLPCVTVYCYRKKKNEGYREFDAQSSLSEVGAPYIEKS